jgi:hypothetical protein
MVLFAAVLVSSCATLPSGPAVQVHVAEYRACPGGGASFWLRPFEAGPDVRWAGEANWLEPKPVPADQLSDPSVWIRPATALRRHEALRRKVGLSVPRGARRILLFQRTKHWISWSDI